MPSQVSYHKNYDNISWWEEGQTTTPTGFASKRTSAAEEKYKPFLLEFASLKFCFDKFADILWGMPVEVETGLPSSTRRSPK